VAIASIPAKTPPAIRIESVFTLDSLLLSAFFADAFLKKFRHDSPEFSVSIALRNSSTSPVRLPDGAVRGAGSG